MAKTYRVTFMIRFTNWLMTALVRLGLPVGLVHLLTVRGRKSGKPITTPLAVILQEGKRYLIAPFGAVNWVRNLRAASGEATLTRGRRTEVIRAIELTPQAAAPILRATVRSGRTPNFVLGFLNVTADSSLEEFEHEALNHPIFLLQPAV